MCLLCAYHSQERQDELFHTIHAHTSQSREACEEPSLSAFITRERKQTLFQILFLCMRNREENERIGKMPDYLPALTYPEQTECQRVSCLSCGGLVVSLIQK